MSPSSRVHPPVCLIWTFRQVSFACGPRPCLYFQCLFVICPTCIQTNGSFEVSLCRHYVSLRVLVLTSHLVHAPTHVDEIDWCSEINCVSCKEIKVWCVSMIEMTRGALGDRREYIVSSKVKRMYCTHPNPLSIDLRTPRWNRERTSGGMCDT